MSANLTPSQIAQNAELEKLPVITDLRQGQDEMRESIDDLSKVITTEQESNRKEFAKGTEKFKEIQGEIAEVREDMSTLRSEMKKGFDSIGNQIGNLKTELKDDELKKLTDELGSKKAFKNSIMSGVIIAIATIILTAIFSNMPNVKISPKQAIDIAKQVAK